MPGSETGIVPDLHGHADHLMPLLLQQGRGHRRVDPAAHGDDDAFFLFSHKL